MCWSVIQGGESKCKVSQRGSFMSLEMAKDMAGRASAERAMQLDQLVIALGQTRKFNRLPRLTFLLPPANFARHADTCTHLQNFLPRDIFRTNSFERHPQDDNTREKSNPRP